jgi:hypothetical protein
MWASEELPSRAVQIIQRLPREAEYARFVPIKLERGGSSWVPRQHNCHANVATVVNWYEGLKQRLWLSGSVATNDRRTTLDRRGSFVGRATRRRPA